VNNTKTPRESAVESRYLVMPQHANDCGIAFGGTIMSWIDMVAAMVAQRHCEREVVTVSIDKLSFLAPIQIGDHVLLKASVNYVGQTSMEVGVQVIKENPYQGESVRATTAYLTFVGIDRNKKPLPAGRNCFGKYGAGRTRWRARRCKCLYVLIPSDVRRGCTVWCPGFSLLRHPKGWTPNSLRHLCFRFAKDSGFYEMVAWFVKESDFGRGLCCCLERVAGGHRLLGSAGSASQRGG
jgi:acyl-CoA hydrolase